MIVRVFEFLTDRPEFFTKWVASNLQNSKAAFYHRESMMTVTVESDDDAILWQMRFSLQFNQLEIEEDWTLPFDKDADFLIIRKSLLERQHAYHTKLWEEADAEERRLGKLARLERKWRNPNASIRTMQHSSRRASR